MDLNQIENRVSRLEAEYKASFAILATSKAKLRKTRAKLSNALESQGIAQKVASMVQNRAHEKLASVVSQCLRAVFSDPYEFRIRFDRKKGKTYGKLVFMREGQEIDPLTASGGGVIDVAAFALRLSCLILSKPPLRRVMVLDEPFRFVSREYRQNVKDMLLSLADQFKIQFIIVTHYEDLEVGKIVRI